MSASYDIIVAGLGAMGSLTLHELARRGQRALGLDRFAPPHAMGSSHGHSRIIREAYFEDPRYVPFVQRAYEAWNDLETQSGVSLFKETGGLMLGRPDSELVRGAQLSAQVHSLPHELLSATDVARKFPAFRPDADMVGVWEPRAGILSPEAAIGAALTVAQRNGATVHTNEPMLSWRPAGDGVEVVTRVGRYHAASLVIAAGAWTGDLLADLNLPLSVQRNVQMFYSVAHAPELFTPDAFPIFICEYAPGRAWYGFPDTGGGLKVARHHHGVSVHPDTIDRHVTTEEIEGVRALLQRFIPRADGMPTATAVCMYTNSPDGHFVIGRHPGHAAVVVASPCSGHGFKFASVIGELLADLATGHTPNSDMSLFALDRFRS